MVINIIRVSPFVYRMETLKRHLPVSGQEGLHELRKIAIRFEEKTYTAATSQSDYLRKISLKMLTLETKSQNPIGNALPSNSAGNSNKSSDAGKYIKELCAWFYLHINPPCFSLWCCVFDTEIIISRIFMDYIHARILTCICTYTETSIYVFICVYVQFFFFLDMDR